MNFILFFNTKLMCIICRWNSGDEKLDPNIKLLDCSNCTTLTAIPVMTELVILYCKNCTALTNIPTLPKLKILRCEGSTALTSIPVLPILEALFCSFCTALTNIPTMSKLQQIFCTGCTALTSIPVMEELEILYCNECTALTSIPAMPELRELDCGFCTSLTDIPYSSVEEVWYVGCKWFQVCKEFDSNIKSLRSCQAIAKRKLTARKLEKLIPAIVDIYYSPGYKGAYIAEKNFLALHVSQKL
jgi:hypothetical protein